jgi:hypothetical protein
VAPVHRGPWYCYKCRAHLFLNGHDDPIEDVALIDYLWLGKEPVDAVQHDRLTQLAKVFRAEGSEL